MYIGVGIFLIVVGAILTFALNASFDAVNLAAIGWICMAAGLLAILLSLVLANRRTATGAGGYSSRRVSHTDPNTGTQVDEVDVDRRDL